MNSLTIYLAYAVLFSVVIFAFPRPYKREELQTNPLIPQNEQSETRDRVELVESGEEGAIVRIRLIENAKESIDISYYSLQDGTFTKILLGSIMDAADRGVEVRMILDGLTKLTSITGEFKNVIYGLEAHQNIELKFYEPINLLFPMSWNRRLHDKIIIVDENLALIGGRNIADKYYLEHIEQDNFSKDRDAIIYKDESRGDYDSVISDMKSYFEQTWNYKNSKPFKKALHYKKIVRGDVSNRNLKYDYLKLRETAKEKIEQINWYDHTIAVDSIKFVYNPEGKMFRDPLCIRALLQLASQAEESMFIQSPYIIPTRRMKTEYKQHDVDVEKITVLTNSYYSSPNPLAISGYSSHRKRLVDSDATIYEYQGQGSIHSKTYMFDDYISVVGSYNLDARSSYLNTESMVVIRSKEFAELLKENIQVDLDKSLKVGKDYSYEPNDKVAEGKVSVLKRMGIAILSLITRLFGYLL